MTDRELPNYWPGNCFGCSSEEGQGLRLRFHISGETCWTRTTLPDHLRGFEGLAHGGIIALLLDEAAQWTLIGRLGRLGLTREATVHYLKPVPTGQKLVVSGRLVELGERQARIKSTIHSNSGELLAEGESAWALRPLSIIAGVAGVEEHRLREFLANYEP